MRNLTMMTDLYQLTMMYGYYKHGMSQNEAVFDLFFRTTRPHSEYSVMAGTQSVIEYINDLHFSQEDIAYLRSLALFDEDFLHMLEELRFTGEIYGMEEGTLVFPYEPLLRVRAPIMEAQLVETALLTLVNHQTLIATKASRVVHAAQGDAVLEFGLRRAQGPDAGIYGARAAVVGGCDSTSNVLAGQWFGLGVKGTHAHSWVMSFPDEISAFRAYADIFPTSCMLLVDTYDTLRSGVPNAIKVFDELRAKGYEPVGIRLDSGDLAYLSKKARIMMDEAGYPNAKIFASSDLDEYVIRDLKTQGAKIDVWGVGTRMITSADWPALGGVYKLAAEKVGGEWVPRIKISENPAGEKEKYTLGQRAADAIAKFAGSWAFIFAFTGVLILWMLVNTLLAAKAFDPYPFILLNLMLSCVAAIQAPLIMMSQNRQEDKDRRRAENDYKVNLKTEIMIEDLYDKVNAILARQTALEKQLTEKGESVGQK